MSGSSPSRTTPELLQANVLMVPRDLHLDRRPETDGLLEI